MTIGTLSRDAYYRIKPILPRRLQIELRRVFARRLRERCRAVWPIYDPAGRPPPGWAGWPGGRRFALVLTHDVETARGHDRCRRLAAMEARRGMRSSFNFVPERYPVSGALREWLTGGGFEVGAHGLRHDGRLFASRAVFLERAARINRYLERWGAVGFRAPAMHHNLEWLHALNVEYDLSTFDTDPFEPQPDGAGTCFPFWVAGGGPGRGYVEMPYTLPQDFTLFVLLGETDIRIWEEKLRWIAKCGGMALINTHPDYMAFDRRRPAADEYPPALYERFLELAATEFEGLFWQALPREVARFIRSRETAPASDREGL